jgi:hypothetical protein
MRFMTAIISAAVVSATEAHPLTLPTAGEQRFPRTVAQAEALDLKLVALETQLHSVLCFEAAEEEQFHQLAAPPSSAAPTTARRPSATGSRSTPARPGCMPA